MLFLDEARDDAYKTLLQGRVKELFDGFRSAKIRKLPEFQSYFGKLSSNLPIEQGVKIIDVKEAPASSSGESIQTITYTSKDGAKKRITASYYVDNTDDAALLSRLKVTRLPGLEQFYGQKNIEYMSAGMMMKFKNVDWQKFSAHFNSLTPQEKKVKKIRRGFGERELCNRVKRHDQPI